MSSMDPNKRKEDSFFEKLTGLLDAGPEQSTLPATKKRRVEDIVSEVCEESGEKPQKTQPVRPWVYEDYLVRLKSFKASTWFAMPAEISPLECARQGWTNSGPSTLKCLSCGVEVVHTEDVSDSDFRASLSTRHESYCGWNDNPSSESFCYFQVEPKTSIQDKFRSRAGQLLRALDSEQSGEALGPLLLSGVDGAAMAGLLSRSKLGVSEDRVSVRESVLSLLNYENVRAANALRVLDSLRRSEAITFPIPLTSDIVSPLSASVASADVSEVQFAEAVSNDAGKILSNSIILTIFGWVARPGGEEGSGACDLYCDTCGRSVQLSSESSQFNGISQHRFFCPWVASTDQHVCGWEAYASSIVCSAGIKPASTDGALRCGSSAGAPLTSSENLSNRNAAESSAGNRLAPAEMFRKIQSIFSMLSGSPYYIPSSETNK